MKSTKILTLLIAFLIASYISNNIVNAQEGVPPEVASILKMKLDEGQAKFESLGYEICSSSFSGKKQDWFNESAKICVTVNFDKKSKEIVEVLLNPAISECQKGLEASREVWEKYHNGQAPINTAKIEEERKKLFDQGFRVSYWINEVSPGRDSEYWERNNSKDHVYCLGNSGQCMGNDRKHRL